MISVGIVGATDYNAGELIRLLVNHPDVNLVKLCDNKNQGMSIVSIHHGLIGETNLTVSPIEKLEDIDVLFISLNSKPLSCLSPLVSTNLFSIFASLLLFCIKC